MYRANNVSYTDNFFENNKRKSYNDLKGFINENYKHSDLRDFEDYQRKQARELKEKNKLKHYRKFNHEDNQLDFHNESDRVWTFLANNLILNSQNKIMRAKVEKMIKIKNIEAIEMRN